MKLKYVSCILIIVILLCGCSTKTDKRKEAAIDYLNGRDYDDNFTYLYVTRPVDSVVRYYFASEKYPDKKIMVECCKGKAGEYICADNYIGVKYEQETRDLIKEILGECFEEVGEITYNVACGPASGKNDTSFEEYVSDSSSGISFVATVKYPSACSYEAARQYLKDVISRYGVNMDGILRFSADLEYTETRRHLIFLMDEKGCFDFDYDESFY